MKTVAIVQARMSSSRLPGKVLAVIVGRPMLHHVLVRARRATRLDDVVLATSASTSDDPLAAFCAAEGVQCIRGSEDDVLDRYRSAAAATGAAVVVRLTADCPLLDPAVIDRVIARYEEGGYDYVSNVDPPTFPDGLDTEVFSRAALERAWSEAAMRSEREHVTPYVRAHPELFWRANVASDVDLSAMRWTVDDARDLAFIRSVYDSLGDGPFGIGDVLALLERRPELGALNTGIERNAGYARSLRQDRASGSARS